MESSETRATKHPSGCLSEVRRIPPKLASGGSRRFRWDAFLVILAGTVSLLEFLARSSLLFDQGFLFLLTPFPAWLLIFAAGGAGIWVWSASNGRRWQLLACAVALAVLTAGSEWAIQSLQAKRRGQWFQEVGLARYQGLVTQIRQSNKTGSETNFAYKNLDVPFTRCIVFDWVDSKPVTLFVWPEAFPRFGYLHDPDDDGKALDLSVLRRMSPCWFEVLL